MAGFEAWWLDLPRGGRDSGNRRSSGHTAGRPPPWPRPGWCRGSRTTSRAQFRSNSVELEQLIRKRYLFPVTWMAGLTKQEYYHALGKCRVLVSTALVETFGYCAMEAVALGVHPVCPRRLSYPDILPDEYLYGNREDALDKITAALASPKPDPPLAARYDDSVDRIIDVLTGKEIDDRY